MHFARCYVKVLADVLYLSQMTNAIEAVHVFKLKLFFLGETQS